MSKVSSNSNKLSNDFKQVVEQITRLSDKQTMHIQNLTRIGVALSNLTNLDRIFDLILIEALNFTNADAATIYKVSDDKKYLDFVIVYNQSLNLQMGGLNDPVTWPSIPLYNDKGEPGYEHIVVNVYHNKQLLCFDDVYETELFDVSGTKEIDKQNNYRTKSMLTLPLKNHEEEVLGVIQIINPLNKKGKVVPFREEHIVMLKSLASQAAIAMSNRKLINDLENLLMEFMHSIAKGIERKSKYSSNHITRVAQISDMIAGRINDSDKGVYADVQLDANQLKELSMAGLMHDVGKIVTPVHIMDKSTKLETIVDRMEIVNLRFKLFKQVLALLKSQQGEAAALGLAKQWYAQNPPQTYKELSDRIDDDQIFLAKVNIGMEYLPDESINRINRISNIAFEFESEKWVLLTNDEVRNLQIRRGTLSGQEKQTMDEHVIATWEMLSELTFPQKYKNVALYAASHHEKLNGSGHPFGLKAEQLPLQSRILAVADIFEALTASDRPYKNPNKLSEAMKILAYCARDKEIDGDILDFLLDSGIYRDYANQYMQSEYLDEVDVADVKNIYHQDKDEQKD